jgi:hypothetical protein
MPCMWVPMSGNGLLGTCHACGGSTCQTLAWLGMAMHVPLCFHPILESGFPVLVPYAVSDETVCLMFIWGHSLQTVCCLCSRFHPRIAVTEDAVPLQAPGSRKRAWHSCFWLESCIPITSQRQSDGIGAGKSDPTRFIAPPTLRSSVAKDGGTPSIMGCGIARPRYKPGDDR